MRVSIWNRLKHASLGVTLLALGLTAGAALWWWSERRLEQSQDQPILEAAARYNLDPALVKAVVWKESRFKPNARGQAGEVGLMQLMDPAAQEWAESVRAYPLSERHLFDPRTNTLAGAWYLRKLLQRYRNTDNPVSYALADYNAGRANVLKWAKATAATNSHEFLAQIGFPSTRDYVQSILGRWRHYQREPAFRASAP
jgi:soluble lytic murein transglycosylase